MLPDGRARVQVAADAGARDSAGLHRFVAEVTALAPEAGGPAVTIVAAPTPSSRAFRIAAIGALLPIALILRGAAPGAGRGAGAGAAAAVGLLTVLVAVLLPLPLNFANIIALPLLLGVGVSFNIYFVMNWRAGSTRRSARRPRGRCCSRP